MKRAFATLGVLCALGAAAAAQDFEFKGSGWVNSKPLEFDRLKGKVVVLLLFEESWPGCAKNVPVWNAERQKYAGKPVVHIAVNSGNPKSAVEGWAKENKFEWPLLVDEARETEKSLGTEISLQNVHRTYIFKPDGTRSEAGLISTLIDKHLAKAAFLFDGIAIPDKLKPLAEEAEFGHYESAVPQIAALAQKNSKELGEAAAAMYGRIKALAEAKTAKAKGLEASDKYGAYAEYAQVAAWFKKTDYEKPAAAAMAELKKDKAVQDEIAAQQMLAQAKQLLAAGKKPDKAGAAGLLAALQKKYPSSAAAKEAAKLAESAK